MKQPAVKQPEKPAGKSTKTETTAPAKIADEPKTVDPATFMPEKLAKKVTLKFEENILQEIIDSLQKEQKVDVLADVADLLESTISGNEPISERLDEEPLYLLFDRLRGNNLWWYLDDGIVHITTPRESTESCDDGFVYRRRLNRCRIPT